MLNAVFFYIMTRTGIRRRRTTWPRQDWNGRGGRAGRLVSVGRKRGGRTYVHATQQQIRLAPFPLLHLVAPWFLSLPLSRLAANCLIYRGPKQKEKSARREKSRGRTTRRDEAPTEQGTTEEAKQSKAKQHLGNGVLHTSPHHPRGGWSGPKGEWDIWFRSSSTREETDQPKNPSVWFLLST